MATPVPAAATMGQVRNLLRGIAFTQQESPATVLELLDHAMAGLGVGNLVSVVAMRIEQTPVDAAAGLRHLRWSNAGHPAPMHMSTEGTVTALHTGPEMMLGARPDTHRSDHETDLHPGDSLLLYTDGLIERRGQDLDTGEAWLTATLTDQANLVLEDLCDHLLTQVGTQADDDIVILALRAHPEDQPRPTKAGPRDTP